jgi:hypothetical protein
MEQKVMKFIVFWISSNINKNRGYTTPAVAARFKDFDDESKAWKFYTKMSGLATADGEYQSRKVSNVTRGWV